MEANELRIGNYVNYKYWNPEPNNEQYLFESVKIIGFLKNNFYFNFKGRNEIEKVLELHPIPLTEEWLLKFGLKNEKGFGFKNEIAYYLIKEQNNSFFIGIRYEHDESEYYFVWDITFIHQLQNLYFALTGEELTIKDS